MSVLTERLLAEVREQGDGTAVIRQMDAWISTLYELMNMTQCITAYSEISEHYRELGFSIGDFFLDLLRKCRNRLIDSPRSGMMYYCSPITSP